MGFNPKWVSTDPLKTYVGLEIADFCSYQIYKRLRYGPSADDKLFRIIEAKLHKYPNYKGKGLKIIT